jgi:hypothetical protein
MLLTEFRSSCPANSRSSAVPFASTLTGRAHFGDKDTAAHWDARRSEFLSSEEGYLIYLWHFTFSKSYAYDGMA